MTSCTDKWTALCQRQHVASCTQMGRMLRRAYRMMFYWQIGKNLDKDIIIIYVLQANGKSFVKGMSHDVLLANWEEL